MSSTTDKLMSGAEIVTSWLGAGAKPVSQEQADRRGAVCRECPKNTVQVIWSWWTVPVANTVLLWAKLKNGMKLKVDKEEGLGTCQVCLCHLPTKVWVPTEFLKENTPKEVLEELPEACWVKQELK